MWAVSFITRNWAVYWLAELTIFCITLLEFGVEFQGINKKRERAGRINAYARFFCVLKLFYLRNHYIGET